MAFRKVPGSPARSNVLIGTGISIPAMGKALSSKTLGITITGVEETDKALALLPLRLQAMLVQDATNVAATKVVARWARRRAPKDTGAMANSIRVRNIGWGKAIFKVDKLRNLATGARTGTAGMIGVGSRKNYNGSQVYTRVKDPQRGPIQYHAVNEFGLKDRDYEGSKFLRSSLYDTKELTIKIFQNAMKRFLREGNK